MRVVLVVIAMTCAHALACQPAEPNDTTRFGGNESVEIQEAKPVRAIEGTVIQPGDGAPLPNVLVEVFLTHASGDTKQRVAACVTTEDGRFVLSIPPAKYEVRFSVGAGWNVTSAFVVVKKRSRPRPLRIQMSLGT